MKTESYFLCEIVWFVAERGPQELLFDGHLLCDYK